MNSAQKGEMRNLKFAALKQTQQETSLKLLLQFSVSNLCFSVAIGRAGIFHLDKQVFMIELAALMNKDWRYYGIIL